MARKVRVTYTDGHTAEAYVTPRAEIETERHYDMSILESSRIEHFYYLAWASLHFAGKESADFDGFTAIVADVENAVDASNGVAPPSPTTAGLSLTGSSD